VGGRRLISPLAFTVLSVRDLPLKGASGVTASAAGVLLVEDDLGIYRLSGATASIWAGPDLHEALGDLEGITASADGQTVWALSEESATLVELRLRGGRPRVARVASLARPGSKKNKGFEGIAYAAAAVSPTRRDAFVAVHEHKPRRVCVFDAATLALRHDLKLPADAKAVLDDLADVAVDPISGTLVLLSEQSRRLAVAEIRPEGLRLVGTFDLPLTCGERPEGVTFLSRTRLGIVTEGPARLLTLGVTRPRRRGVS
jgi:uncharacterized protein YjiK